MEKKLPVCRSVFVLVWDSRTQFFSFDNQMMSHFLNRVLITLICLLLEKGVLLKEKKHFLRYCNIKKVFFLTVCILVSVWRYNRNVI